MNACDTLIIWIFSVKTPKFKQTFKSQDVSFICQIYSSAFLFINKVALSIANKLPTLILTPVCITQWSVFRVEIQTDERSWPVQLSIHHCKSSPDFQKSQIESNSQTASIVNTYWCVQKKNPKLRLRYEFLVGWVFNFNRQKPWSGRFSRYYSLSSKPGIWIDKKFSALLPD